MGAPAIAVPSRTKRPAPKRGRKPAPARRVSTPSRRVGGTSSRAGAAAPARRAPQRKSPKPRTSARTAPQRRHSITPPGGVVMLPVAAVGAVGGMADSGLMVGLTRGRLWIGVLGVLLGGIVAINVWGLSLSASTSAAAAKIDELERANSVAGARIAKRTSTVKVEAGAAADLGFGVPSADAVRYLKYKPAMATTAAERLASGEISVLDSLPIAPELAAAAAGASDPSVPIEPVIPAAPVDPATVPPEPIATAPEDAASVPSVPVEPVAPAPTPAPTSPDAGGGISP